MRSRRIRRGLAGAALVAGIVALVLVLESGADHTLHIRFMDAGQIVTGDAVSVAGRPIGSITAVTLAEDGTADLTAHIDDSAWPLHLGTQAQIRLTSLSGLANRYIELAPGLRDAPVLPDGATIDLNATQGVVDLDEVLDSFTPPVRRDLKSVIAGFDRAGHGAARAGNDDLRLAPAALTAADRFTAQLTEDPPAMSDLLRAGARVSIALARHGGAITDGITATRTWLDAAARSRGAISGTLRRAPAVLAQLDDTLRRTRASLRDPIRPVLRELTPSARPLAGVVTSLERVGRPVAATLRQLRVLLPAVDATFAQLPALSKSAIPAVTEATKSLAASEPIFAGLRAYGPDLVAGQFTELGAVAGYYDANGHYARIPVDTSRNGLPGTASAIDPTVGPIDNAFGVDGLRVGLIAPCPGGAENPVDDKSNPYTDDPSLCDARDDQP